MTTPAPFLWPDSGRPFHDNASGVCRGVCVWCSDLSSDIRPSAPCKSPPLAGHTDQLTMGWTTQLTGNRGGSPSAECREIQAQA